MRKRKRLAAVLVGSHLCDNLRCYIAGSEEAVRLLDHGLADDRAVLQHILQIDQVAVVLLLRVIIRIVEVNDALFMRADNIFRKEDSLGQILGDLAGHIITLRRIDDRILIGILLLYLFVLLIDERKYPVVRRVRFPGQLSLVAVTDILLRDFVAAHLHDPLLDHVLNVFNVDRVRRLRNFPGDILRDRADLILIQLINAAYLFIGLSDCVYNLLDVKTDLLAISFNNVCVNRYCCVLHYLFRFH